MSALGYVYQIAFCMLAFKVLIAIDFGNFCCPEFQSKTLLWDSEALSDLTYFDDNCYNKSGVLSIKVTMKHEHTLQYNLMCTITHLNREESLAKSQAPMLW